MEKIELEVQYLVQARANSSGVKCGALRKNAKKF